MSRPETWRRRLTVALLVPLALAAGSVLARAADTTAADAGQVLGRHAAALHGLQLAVAHALGPLPAIAGTPFFGLSVLATAALVADSDAVQSSRHPFAAKLRDNALIREARRYASPGLLAALIALSVITYLANTGKIRGLVGKLIRAGEDSSVVVTYVLLAASVLARADAPAPAPAQMGLLAAPEKLAAGLALALGLVALVVVRLAFDLLVWLSPFPLVDFIFESLKLVISALWLGLYLLFPAAAAVAALVALLIALLALGWSLRVLHFAWTIVFAAMLARLFPELKPRLVAPRLAARFAAEAGEVRLALGAAVLRARGLPRRASVMLWRGSNVPQLSTRTLLGHLVTRPLAAEGERLALGRCLLWIELRVLDAGGRVRARFALPRTLGDDYQALLGCLGAQDHGAFGAARLWRSGGEESRARDAVADTPV